MFCGHCVNKIALVVVFDDYFCEWIYYAMYNFKTFLLQHIKHSVDKTI